MNRAAEPRRYWGGMMAGWHRRVRDQADDSDDGGGGKSHAVDCARRNRKRRDMICLFPRSQPARRFNYKQSRRGTVQVPLKRHPLTSADVSRHRVANSCSNRATRAFFRGRNADGRAGSTLRTTLRRSSRRHTAGSRRTASFSIVRRRPHFLPGAPRQKEIHRDGGPSRAPGRVPGATRTCTGSRPPV